MLKVNEIFKGIQGESVYAGLPCTFIRLTGCNLRCNYCDTTYAYDEGRNYSFDDLLNEVESFGCNLVEITGGEPLLQEKVLDFLDQLARRNQTVLLETNGTKNLRNVNPSVVKIMDIKCPGSGDSGSTDWDNLNYLSSEDQVKFVISNREDFDWSVDVIKKRGLDRLCPVLFSPNFDLMDSKELAEWILDGNINVRFQPQMHKYIWGEGVRGV